MLCPYCKYKDTKVIDSREVAEGLQIRRRRECCSCQSRFTTYETIEYSLPRVVKKDGSSVAFNPDKIRRGVLRSIEKRPVKIEQVEKLISQITDKLQSFGEREISSGSIGKMVMELLLELDQVAYVRFASVYRRYGDIDEFLKEIAELHAL